MIVPVKKFTIVTLTEFEDMILGGLAKLGAVQVENLREGEYTGFREVIGESREYRELYGRFQTLYRKYSEDIKISMEKPSEIQTKIPLEDLRIKLDELGEKLTYLDRLKKIRQILNILNDHRVNPKDLGEFKHVFTKVGTIDSSQIPNFKGAIAGRKDVTIKISPISDKNSFLFMTGLAEARPLVEKALQESRFREFKLPPEVPDNIDEALTWSEWETELTKNKAQEFVMELHLGSRIEYSEKISAAQSNLLRSQTTSIIGGWIPEDKINTLNDFLESVNEKTGGRLVSYYEDPKAEEEVPTVMKNPRIFRLYETLTRQYGTPSHEEIDPTPIMGILWTIMFGFMFPDFGQGLIILLLGAYFAYGVKKPLMGMSFKRIGQLMLGLGLSAMFFGLLTGSVFLIEIQPLFPGLEPRWLEDALTVLWLIKIAVFFGIASIIIGIVLNILNSYKANEKIELLFGERGIAGLIIFIGLVLTAFHFIGITVIPGVLRFPSLHMDVLTHWSFFILIGGICLLPIKSIVEKEGVITSLGPIIEDVIGFLVNMMSYTRIAGFAIAHAALAIVVHEMLAANPAIGVGMGLIFLNFFSVTIEMLVVMIQALRLLYYEFSTKFVKGTGIVFEPLKV